MWQRRFFKNKLGSSCVGGETFWVGIPEHMVREKFRENVEHPKRVMREMMESGLTRVIGGFAYRFAQQG